MRRILAVLPVVQKKTGDRRPFFWWRFV